MSGVKRRQTFPAVEKQNMVTEWKNTPVRDRSLAATANHHGVKSSGAISKWSRDSKLFNQETGEAIPLAPHDRCKKKFSPGPTLKRPELEQHLKSYWQQLREEGKAVTVWLLILESKRFFAEIDSPDASLHPDTIRSIVRRFMKRHGLTYRASTHSGKFMSEHEMSETILDFVSAYKELVRTLDIHPGEMFNMDETAVYFDNTPTKTIEMRGKKSISMRICGNASHRVTVLLCVSFTGKKLPPLVVFKGGRDKTIHKKLRGATRSGCNPSCEYTVQERGWCDQNVMNDWIELFVKNTDRERLNLLLMDNFSVHCTAATHGRLAENGTYIELLPPNFTSKLQPLDVGVNKPFKDRLKQIYVEYAARAPVGVEFRVTRSMISDWIAYAWDGITPQTITNTIRKIGFVIDRQR